MRTSCEEWSGILCWYRSAVRIYSDATAALEVRGSFGFNEAWEVSEEARKACGRFRAALLEHEHKHGCQVAPPNAGALGRSAAISVRCAEVNGGHRVVELEQPASPRSFRTLAVGEEWR